jgi:hypothetical protein
VGVFLVPFFPSLCLYPDNLRSSDQKVKGGVVGGTEESRDDSEV